MSSHPVAGPDANRDQSDPQELSNEGPASSGESGCSVKVVEVMAPVLTGGLPLYVEYRNSQLGVGG